MSYRFRHAHLSYPPNFVSNVQIMVRELTNLTARDHDLLDVLTQRVRVLSIQQIGEEWFAGSKHPLTNAKRRVTILETRRLVECFSMVARPLGDLNGPIRCWRPGQPLPDFGQLSHQVCRRWSAPATPMRCVIATRAAGVWLGGSGGRRPRRSEISHDLVLASVYFAWRRCAGNDAASWLSEARLRRLGFGDEARLPDAMIETNGRRTVIEVGGVYTAVKLREFHDFCAGRRLAYELW